VFIFLITGISISGKTIYYATQKITKLANRRKL